MNKGFYNDRGIVGDQADMESDNCGEIKGIVSQVFFSIAGNNADRRRHSAGRSL